MVTDEQLDVIKLSTGFEPDLADTQTRMVHKMAETWQQGREWTRGQCRICSQPVTVDPDAEYQATVCDQCGSVVDEHYKVKTEIQAGPQWEDECPPLYQDM